jgi:hypothetical protein
VDLIQTSVEYVPGALPGRSSVRGVKLIVYLLIVLQLRVCEVIPPFATYTPSWRVQQEVFPVVDYVVTCSNDFILGVLCEVREKDSRADYIRPFVRPSVRLFCGLIARKQEFVKMGADSHTSC